MARFIPLPVAELAASGMGSVDTASGAVRCHQTGVVRLVQPSDLWEARRMATAVAEAAGASDEERYRVVTSVAELASNVLAHGVEGEISVSRLSDAAGRVGVQIEACDFGPGIGDPALALRDGFSTGAGLGCGLAAVKRLMGGVHIAAESGAGTTVSATCWLRGSRPAASSRGYCPTFAPPALVGRGATISSTSAPIHDAAQLVFSAKRPPSPRSTSMGKYQFHPDRLPTGKPLMTLELAGTLDEQEAHELLVELNGLIDACFVEGSVCLLIDQRKQTTITATARRALAAAAKDPRYERFAFVGGSVLVRTLARFIIRAAGRDASMRFFDDAAPALAWFAEGVSDVE
ncbi:MAG: ATP-binding protein [Myxococcales bacterium]|nr:ATP-binding protein [Myxococcales bacterium]